MAYLKVLFLFFFLTAIACSSAPSVSSNTAVQAPAPTDDMFFFVDINDACNMSFYDRLHSDKEGGWIDEGDNDVRMLPTGLQNFLGIPVNIIEPSINKDKSCVVLYGDPKQYFPTETPLLKVGQKASRLYFLHAAGWDADFLQTIAHYVISYSDGSSTFVPVKFAKDAYNFWVNASVTNCPSNDAKIAWSGTNPYVPIAIYLMKWENPKPELEIESIQMVSARTNAVPVLLAITGISDPSENQDHLLLLDRYYDAAPRPPSTPEKAALLPPTVKRADGLITEFYRLNHTKAQNLLPLLLKWKTEKGDILASEELNMLLITDTEENIKIINNALTVLDKPGRQVMIEAKIVEVTKESDLELGVELQYLRPTDSKTLLKNAQEYFPPEQFLKSILAPPFQGGTFTFARIGGHSGEVNSLLKTLVSKGTANILSSPQILVMNGQTANIVTGQEVPIQSVQTQGSNTFVLTSFKEIGVKLNVAPKLIGQSDIQLFIKPEVSLVTGFTTPGPNTVSNPIISKRSAETTVEVRNGEMIVIGGLVKSESRQIDTQIPLLGDIPFLGYAFKSHKNENVKSELLFFLTPYILNK